MTTCPQCGAENEDDVKNCKSCRVNMYWAFQHYEELARLREANKLAPRPQSASFLVETSKRIDDGPTANWLHNTIKKFGFKGAGKKVSTISD
jgi:hypothetical protein